MTEELFNFEGKAVRFVGTWEYPEWVAQDVCDILEIQNARDAVSDFDDDERGVASIYTPSGLQNVVTLKEAGLYKLLFRSRKPIAKRFSKWVTNEVLPSIRKKGYYGKPKDGTYWYERMKIAMSSNIRPLPRGYFSIYLRMSDLFRQLEQRFNYIIPDLNPETEEYLVPDISVGRMFNDFLRSDEDLPKAKRLEFLNSEEIVDFQKPNGKNYNEIEFYEHIYPESSHTIKNNFIVNAYPNKYASIFDYFFEYHWIPERFNSYIKERDPEGYRVLQNKINSLTSGDKSILKSTLLNGVIEKFLSEGK